jgi:hypothetical protein
MPAVKPMLSSRIFRVPKQGNSIEEYEDAAAENAARGRFAVADGSAESGFAGIWANLLVRGFVREPAGRPEDWARWLPPLQEAWSEQAASQPLPWYGQAKLEQGAFAAFLGVTLKPSAGPGEGVWEAIAVGDTCLFQVCREALCRFPVETAGEFGTSPWLVGSRVPAERMIEKQKFHVRRGEWKVGDRLWMMTDALAEWFLRRYEAAERPWEALARFPDSPDGQAEFEAWVEILRDAGEMRNDDVTLLTVLT